MESSVLDFNSDGYHFLFHQKKYEGIATFCKSEKRRKNISQSIERKLREQIQFQICIACTFWSCDGTRCHLVHRTVLRHEFYAKSNEHRHDPSRFPDGYRIIPGNAIFCNQNMHSLADVAIGLLGSKRQQQQVCSSH